MFEFARSWLGFPVFPGNSLPGKSRTFPGNKINFPGSREVSVKINF